MFNVSTNGREIKVDVKLKKRKYARDPHIGVDTEKVLDFLTSEGYNLKEYKLTQQSVCSNLEGNGTDNTGTWIWTKKQQKKVETSNATKTTKTRTRTRQRKSNTEEAKDKLL